MREGTAVLGIVVSQFDGRLAREIRQHENYRDFSSWGEGYGSAVQYGGAQMGLYLAGIGLRHDGVREFGLLTIHSAILSGIFSSSLKLMVGSDRPDGAPSSRFDSSFPSGHATGSAALAGTAGLSFSARFGGPAQEARRP